MKPKNPHRADPERLAQLRQREEQVQRTPSAEGYLKLADDYLALGLGKESDRLLQLAEWLENGEKLPSQRSPNGLLSGTANPTMLTEVIQILSRTKLSGDLTIDAQAQTFHLYFDEGHIISASSQHYPAGLKSFRMALRVPHGTYCFVEKAIQGVPRLLGERTEILLLNAMHDADKESAAAGAAEPASEHPVETAAHTVL